MDRQTSIPNLSIQRLALWCPFALLFAVYANTASALTYSSTLLQQQSPLSHHLEYWFEPQSNPVSLTDVRQLTPTQWQSNKDHNPGLGRTLTAVWFRVQLQLDEDFRGYLEIDRSFIDEIDIYQLQHGKLQQHTALGDRRPYAERTVVSRTPTAPIVVQAQQPVELYLRIDTHGGMMQFQMDLVPEHQFWTKNYIELSLHMLYFGGVLTIVLYNLIIFISLRESIYISYIVHALAITATFIAILGYGNLILWPNNPAINTPFILVISPLNHITSYLFIYQFLKLDKNMPVLAKCLWVAIALEVLSILSVPFGGGQIMAKWVGSLQLLIVPLIVASSITLWLKGVKEARFFFTAWTIWYLAIISYRVVNHLDWIEYKPIYMHLLLVAHLVEVILTGLALADRISQAKEQAVKLKELSESHAEKARLLLRTEQHLLTAQKSSLELKNHFLTAISHELRTPMNGIFGGLQLIPSRDEKIRPSIEIIRSSAKDMMRLINDILTYTEIQADQVQNRPVVTEMRPILDKLHKRYSRYCKSRELTLFWEINDDIPCYLLLDKAKLQTVLSKLLDNAIKFTDTGSVTFHASWHHQSASKQLQFVIEDTGIGIEETDNQDLFQPFRQKHQGFQRNFSGLGIGLTICQRLVQAMQGQIDLVSDLGRGCRVHVRLPTEQAQRAAVIEYTNNRQEQDLPILVVEDNPVNQRVLSRMLEKLGHQSLLADNGAEALQVLEQQTVGLVLMDLQMPIMDGFACTENIRKAPAPLGQLPVIAVTANVMEADKERCLNAGMNDYIKKPIKLAFLKQTLEKYLIPEPAKQG